MASKFCVGGHLERIKIRYLKDLFVATRDYSLAMSQLHQSSNTWSHGLFIFPTLLPIIRAFLTK